MAGEIFLSKMPKNKNKTPPWQKSVGSWFGAAENRPEASAHAAIDDLGPTENVGRDQGEQDVS